MMAVISTWITALSTFSSTREKILEHRFIAEITSELWRRAQFDFAVSHSEVDNSGYDLIVEVGRVTRHIQLKAMQSAGKRRDFDLQIRLAEKASGCAILMLHDPVSLAIKGYRLFAGEPGAPLPHLGDKAVRHSKGDAHGVKAERSALRNVPITTFVAVHGIRELVDRLFGAHDSLGGESNAV